MTPDEELAIPQNYTGPSHSTTYYRWVPIIMLCQALLCLLHYIFWRLLNTLSSLKLTAMIRSARRGQYSCLETKIQIIIQYLSNTLRSDMDKTAPLLGIVYSLTKTFYVINCAAQLVFLEWFLDLDNYLHGIQIIVDLIKGTPSLVSSVLPRVMYCNFKIRHTGSGSRCFY